MKVMEAISTMKPEHKVIVKNILRALVVLLGVGLLVCSILLILALLFLLIFPPKSAVTVTNASLTQFKLNDSLDYNLTLDLSIRNPKNYFTNEYKNIQVVTKYAKEEFARSSRPPFTQRPQNTTVLHTVLQGRQSMKFSASDLSRFYLETAAGVYSIDVVATMMVKEGSFGKFFKREWTCSLKLPLSSSTGASPSPTFRAVSCRGRRAPKRRPIVYVPPRKKRFD